MSAEELAEALTEALEAHSKPNVQPLYLLAMITSALAVIGLALFLSILTDLRQAVADNHTILLAHIIKPAHEGARAQLEMLSKTQHVHQRRVVPLPREE